MENKEKNSNNLNQTSGDNTPLTDKEISTVDGIDHKQSDGVPPYITGVEVIEDILKKCHNIPQNVSVYYGENKSLFVSVKIDDNRTFKFEFRKIDETFPTIVLERFLEPFCINIAKTAEGRKKSSPLFSTFLNSQINNTAREVGLDNLIFLFDGGGKFEYKEPPQENNESKTTETSSTAQSSNPEPTVSETRLEEPTLPDGAIGFYKIGDEFGIFSNFAHTPVEIDGHTWFTTEHYYQSWKFKEVEDPASIRAFERILKKKSPVEAAKLGRDKSIPRRPDWKDIKDDAMRVAVASKADQHEEMRENLLKTGDALIVEKAITDAYWGYGPDGNGKNMLGHVLMEVRDAIKENRLDQYIQEARDRLPVK